MEKKMATFHSLFNQVIRSIDVTLTKKLEKEQGVGKEELWDGWDLKPNETPYQCLKKEWNKKENSINNGRDIQTNAPKKSDT